MKENSKEDTDLEFLYKQFAKLLGVVLKNYKDYPEVEKWSSLYQLSNPFLRCLTTIEELEDDLNKVLVFIKRFPQKDYLAKNNINQFDYIRYHLEVYMHKIHTMLEVYRIWINDFYEIGLNHRDCSWNNLKGKKKIRDSQIRITLEDFYKTFKTTINNRHLNTHQAYYKDEEMERLHRIWKLHNFSDYLGFDKNEELKKLFPKYHLDEDINIFRKKKVNFVIESNNAVKHYKEEAFTILLKEYFEKVKTM